MTTAFKGPRSPQNRLGGIRINTSLQGLPIPIVGGRNRISPNLVWYGDFISVAVTGGKKGAGGGGSGKKGGGQYDYGAAVIMALCQGEITRIGNIWANTGYLPANLTQEGYTVPGGGGTYTVTHAATFLQDTGCTREDAYSVSSDDFGSPYGAIILSGNQQTPMTRVATNPPTIAGTYRVAAGAYKFAAADAGKNILINYTYAPPVSAGGTAQDPITTIGFSIFTGAQGQAAWSYITSNHPSEALGYSTVAYAATPRLDLGVSGTLPNFNFEVFGLFPFGNGNWECDPSVWCENFLINPIWGVGFDGSELGSTSQFSDYCVANGLFMSPVCDQQRTAAEYLRDWLEATNTELVESGGVLNFIPRGDTTVVGNGVTFQPDTAPQYDLDDDAFMRDGSAPPIKVKRSTVQDAYNSVKIEYVDVFNNYNPSVVEAQDLGAILAYKYRPESTRSYHFFTQQAPAAKAAQTILVRKVYIRNTYAFKLPTKYFLLDPMDIVTIPANLIYGTDDTTLIAVRLTSVTENADRTLNIEAEDFPWGCSGPTVYPKQIPSPGGPNAYAPPGAVNDPIIFEALSRLNSQIGHNVWFGLSGANQYWGGCRIWVSLDGTNYRQVGTAISQCKMGELTAPFASHADPDTVDTLSVDLTESFGELESGTSGDADSSALLCYVGTGGVGELVSYQDAALTAPYNYDINTYIRRGVFGSVIAAHSSGDDFLLLDDSVEGWNYDVGLIGQTVHFKFTSFNQSGLVEENLADVTDYPYLITGSSIGLLSPAHASYRPDSNPLTAHDAGASATMNIASFNMVVPGMANIPLSSGAITGLSYNTLYYVYYDDPGFIGGAVTYYATTTKTVALGGAGRFFVGSCVTPKAGAPDTTGNDDGGSGAQLGANNQMNFSTPVGTTLTGNGSATNPDNAVGDGTSSLYAALGVTANSGSNSSKITLTSAAAFNSRRYSSLKLAVDFEVTDTTSPGHAGPSRGTQIDWINLVTGAGTIVWAKLAGSGTSARQTLTWDIPTDTNLSQIKIECGIVSYTDQNAGANNMKVYRVYAIGVE